MNDQDDRETRIRSLTRHQFVVLGLRCRGLMIKEIAEILVVTEGTVNYHLGNIYTKLGLQDLSKTARQIELLKFCDVASGIDVDSLPIDPPADELDEGLPDGALVAVQEDERALVAMSRNQPTTEPAGDAITWPPPPDPGKPPGSRWQRLAIVLGVFAVVAAISAGMGALVIHDQVGKQRGGLVRGKW